MKKSMELILVSIILLSLVSPIQTHAQTKQTEVVYIHTFQNIAIYYSDGYFIDEDGEQFEIDFYIPDQSNILVTYDNKNTVTRLDDEPIDFEILKSVKEEG